MKLKYLKRRMPDRVLGNNQFVCKNLLHAAVYASQEIEIACVEWPFEVKMT